MGLLEGDKDRLFEGDLAWYLLVFFDWNLDGYLLGVVNGALKGDCVVIVPDVEVVAAKVDRWQFEWRFATTIQWCFRKQFDGYLLGIFDRDLEDNCVVVMPLLW